jgi:hypothetical protein
MNIRLRYALPRLLIPSNFGFSSRRVLPWDQAKPRSEVTSLGKCRSVSDGSYHRGRYHGTHPRNLLQSLTGRVYVRDSFDLAAGGFDLQLQVLPLLPELIQQLAHQWRKLQLRILQDQRYPLPQIRPATADGDPTFQQKSPDLVDHTGAARNQPIPHSMQCLQIELILGLDGHESHRRPLHGLCDCFGILIVVLVRLYKRAYKLRWNQPHLVPLRDRRGAEMMGATTRFHANRARQHVGKLAEQFASGGSSLNHDVARLVQANQVKDGLSKIDTIVRTVICG